MGFLNGKKLLITGVISNRSIAYGIAKACRREGAELAFTYANERYRERIEGLAADFDSKLVYRMDVGSDEDIAAVVEELGKAWGGLDGFVHSIGFAPREAIAGDFLEGLSRESFKIAMDISAYSYPAMAKAFLPLMKGRQASVLTLTYLGSERVVPNYNTMGLAKAALEHPLSGRQPRQGGHSRERHLRRSHQDACRFRHSGLRQASARDGAGSAARPHCDDGGSRQHGRLPAVRPRKRSDGRRRLRRCGLPCHGRRDDRSGKVSAVY